MTARGLNSRFCAAALLSLLAHAAMVSGGWLRLPAVEPQQITPLEARLVRITPVPPPLDSRQAQRPRQDARPAKAPPRARAAPAPAAPAVARAPSRSSYEAPAPEDSAEAPATDPDPSPQAEAPATPAPRAAPAPHPQEQAEPVKMLPRKGRITYTMYYGSDSLTVGKTVQTWEIDADGYKLGSVSETTGIVDLFAAQRHIYLSEGRFTADGLQPEKFFMSRTRRGRTEAAQALFDWKARTLKLGRAPQQRDAALPSEAQDIVSFMYQLALYPPKPGRMRLPVTNGSRFETYDLDVLDEERIETSLGMLRALPVRQIPREGAESIALWLAVDYRYLPVKIRFFDREGRPTGEQVVDHIEISPE